ncbi:MAG TPA: rhodanese-like domain-containing protein [Bacteroidales bacterium]|nr:rhodanese-like domain-containing protein [Bacteroidales bacterium]
MESFFSGTGFISGGIRNVTPRQALELCRRGALMVDVREAVLSRFKMFDVPEILYCPYSILEETFQELPSDKPLIFADAAGLHSREAVILAMKKGIEDRVANLAGGLIEWERDEMPLIIDKSEKLSGSCMCQLRPRDKK